MCQDVDESRNSWSRASARVGCWLPKLSRPLFADFRKEAPPDLTGTWTAVVCQDFFWLPLSRTLGSLVPVWVKKYDQMHLPQSVSKIRILEEFVWKSEHHLSDFCWCISFCSPFKNSNNQGTICFCSQSNVHVTARGAVIERCRCELGIICGKRKAKNNSKFMFVCQLHFKITMQWLFSSWWICPPFVRGFCK